MGIEVREAGTLPRRTMSQNTESTTWREIQVKGPHAQRRFLQQLNAVQQALQKASALQEKLSPETLPAQIFYRQNGRTPMFLLQGLSRVYENLELDDKLFPRLKLESKIIEDAFGAIDFWCVVAKKANLWSLPNLAQAASMKHFEACGRAWSWLEARDWVNHRYQEQDEEEEEFELTANLFARKLKKVDWLSPKKEHRELTHWLIEELTETQEKIAALDLSHIEHGLHEARRQVRWFSIYSSALTGGIVLDRDAKAPENWDTYLTKEIVENPFNKLAEPEEDDRPISIPAPLFYALSYVIDRLGAIKDRAQWTETMHHLIKTTGEHPEKSLQELMGDVYLEPQDATKLTTEIVTQVFERDRLLPRLIEALEAQQ
jgi:hypothetical protein